jgi:hypothetical protein
LSPAFGDLPATKATQMPGKFAAGPPLGIFQLA